MVWGSQRSSATRQPRTTEPGAATSAGMKRHKHSLCTGIGDPAARARGARLCLEPLTHLQTEAQHVDALIQIGIIDQIVRLIKVALLDQIISATVVYTPMSIRAYDR